MAPYVTTLPSWRPKLCRPHRSGLRSRGCQCTAGYLAPLTRDNTQLCIASTLPWSTAKPIWSSPSDTEPASMAPGSHLTTRFTLLSLTLHREPTVPHISSMVPAIYHITHTLHQPQLRLNNLLQLQTSIPTICHLICCR